MNKSIFAQKLKQFIEKTTTISLFKQFAKVALIIILIVIMGSSAYIKHTFSQEIKNYSIQANDQLCPDNYSLQQCYTYLQQQLDSLQSQQQQLKNKIKVLNSQQNNIYTKLAIIQNQIKSLELDIQELKVSMYLNELQKQSIEKLIKEVQIEISQQNSVLQKAKNKILELLRLKYTLSSFPWYYYVKNGDIQGVIEYMSLINILLTKQKSEIQYINVLKEYINQKEKILDKHRKELKQKEELLAKENQELEKAKAELEKQKKEQQILLAQVAQEEAKLQLAIKQLKSKSNYYNEQLQSILNQMGNNLPPNGTYVAKGSVIGQQGHTGCAYGSHLHFAVLKWTGTKWVYINPISEGLLACSGGCSPGGYIVSKIARTPLNNAYITQNYWSGHHAFDLVSTSDGNQLGSRYCVKKGAIKCSPNTSGCFGLRGEGAPILAIYNGTFYGPKIDYWGGKYVFVIHNINGKKYLSLYVHLR